MNNKESKANILIVDDEVLIAESNKILLRKFGYNPVGIACDGQTAIKTADEKIPDLILMDINLNGSIDGITAAEEIQKKHDIPIIFITAYSDPNTIDRAKKIGPFGYLIKPFEKQELLVSIETTLYKHSFEKRIKEQELLFRTIANFAYEWEFWLSPDLNFNYCSPSCKRVSGYSSDDFVANPNLLSEIVHPDDKSSFVNHLKNYYPGNDNKNISTDFQFKIITKDNEIKYISHTCIPIFDDRNTFIGRRVTNVDITKRKLAEIKLKKSEALFRELAENSPLPIVVVNKENGNFSYANKKVFEIVGELPAGKKISDYNVDDFYVDTKQRESFLKLIDMDGQINGFEINLRLFNNSIITVMASSIITNFNNQPSIFSSFYDITYRKQAEKKIRESEERFRTVYNASPMPISISEIETGKIVEINDAYTRFFGYKKEEVLGRTSFELGIWVDKNDRTKLIKPFKNNGYYDNMELTFRTKSGAEKSSLASGRKISLQNKNYMLTIINDITERKNNEKELIKQLNEINRFNQLMVGRETKMIELKNEINELLEKLGMQKKYNIKE